MATDLHTTHWALQRLSLFGDWETVLRFRYRWTARVHCWLFGYDPDRYRLVSAPGPRHGIPTGGPHADH